MNHIPEQNLQNRDTVLN